MPISAIETQHKVDKTNETDKMIFSAKNNLLYPDNVGRPKTILTRHHISGMLYVLSVFVTTA